MPVFSKRSLNNLKTCHQQLQNLMYRAIEQIDFTVLEGHREKELQDRYVREGKSQLEWPKSKHNADPSLAVDIVPYPIDYSQRERFYFQVGHITGLAERMGIPIRVGMDWDGDYRLVPYDEDETFLDMPHVELDIHYGPESEFWPG